MRRQLLVVCLMMIFCTGLATSAAAYHSSGCIIVNGVRLSAEQITVLERVEGGQIPCGRYWLDTATGIWGFEGGPPQGRLGDRQGNRGYHKRTPFGDLGSDGTTAYWFDPGTGCSVVPGEGVSC